MNDLATRKLWLWLALVPPVILLVLVASAWWFEWTLLWPSSTSDIYEAIGVLANVVLLSVAIRGLGTLTLTRRATTDQITRDARAIAIARAEEFAGPIMQASGPVLNAFASASVTPFLIRGERIDFSDTSPALLQRAKAWTATVPDPGREHAIRLANKLEAWSMYFVSDLADHPLAYGPCAPYFCQLVLYLYPYLIESRARESSGKYPNLVELFEDWWAELNQEKHGRMLEGLQTQVREYQERRARRLRRPYGTDLDG